MSGSSATTDVKADWVWRFTGKRVGAQRTLSGSAVPNASPDASAQRAQRTQSGPGRPMTPPRVMPPVPNQPPPNPAPTNAVTPPQPPPMAQYVAAMTKLQPLFDAAERVLQANTLPDPVAQAKVTYDTAAQHLNIDVLAKDEQQALQSLEMKRHAAQTVLGANARVEGAKRTQEQASKQSALFDDMAPVLGDVKRTYLQPGAADRIGAEKLKPEQEFQTYLTAMKDVEAARKGLDPSKPAANAAQIKTKCETMVGAAQAYLAVFDNLPDQQKADKANQRKKQICEEGMVSARQFAMAMDLDAIGKPKPDQPWDPATEIRANGLRTAMSYETGYQQAKSLKGDGTKGASESYWIKSASAQEGVDERGQTTVNMVANKRGDALFKPIDGEKAPDILGGEKQGAGAVKELLASSNAKMFAAMTGIDLEVPETTVAAVGAYAVGGADPKGPPILGSVQQHAGVSKMLNGASSDVMNKVKPAEAQKIALLDIMSVSVDRHAGNLMVDDSDANNPRLVPIDHGATLPTPEQFKGCSAFFAGMHDGGKGVVTQNTLLGMPAAYEAFDAETVTKLQQLDPAAIEQNMLAQRQALDQVHPNLGAQDKVNDKSFALSKRFMMFLKRAAPMLSPAEVQLALGQHGGELYDIDEADFDTLADKIIAEAVPKKDGYKEIFALSDEHKSEIADWLSNNGWGGAEFLMQDPVTALRVFKAKTPRAAPTATKLPEAQASNAADAAMQKAILAAFPDSANVGAGERVPWKALARQWLTFQQRGQKNYDDAVAATGAAGVGDVKLATEVQQLWQSLQDAWKDANIAPNVGIAAMTPARGSESPIDVLRRTAAAVRGQQRAGDAQQALAQTDDRTLHTTSAQDRLTKADQLIQSIDDPSASAAMTTEATSIRAALTQGDAAQADDDAAALMTKAYNAVCEEKQRIAGEIRDDMRDKPMSDQDRKTIDFLAQQVIDDVEKGANVSFVLQHLDQLKTYIDQVKAALPPAVVLSAFAWDQSVATAVEAQAIKANLIPSGDTGLNAAIGKVLAVRNKLGGSGNIAANASEQALREGIAAYNEFGSFVGGTLRPLSPVAAWQGYCKGAADAVQQEIDALMDAIDQLSTASAAQGGKVALPAFTWDQKGASDVKKRAVKAKLFKDQDTGMTSALAKVTKLRPQLAAANALAAPARRKVLQDGVAAYSEFGRFIASKLRGLSRDPSWSGYCDSAADKVEQEITALQQQLQAIGGGGQAT
jgi:hypothetical protein